MSKRFYKMCEKIIKENLSESYTYELGMQAYEYGRIIKIRFMYKNMYGNYHYSVAVLETSVLGKSHAPKFKYFEAE